MGALFPPAWLASIVLRRKFSVLRAEQAEPLLAQRRAYLRLQKQLAGTEVARLSGLAAAPDLETFARTVPPRDYEYFAGMIERVIERDERSVLFHDRPEFIGLSSCTSGSVPKRIIHNRATLRSFGRWEFNLGAIIEHDTGVNPVVSDRLVWGAVPPNSTRTPHGIEQGYVSGYLSTHSRRILRARTVPPPEVGQIADMKRKIHEAGLAARSRDVRIASAVPSYLLNLLEGLREEWGIRDFAGIWPHLDVVLYSGTPITCYSTQLGALLGRTPRFIGMYLATECALGYEIPSLNGGQLGLYSFHLADTVFTFRKLEGDDRVLTVGDLQVGDDVELLLTTPGGMINYRVGDCLKIRSVCPLLFEITGRIGQGLNLAAEKTTLSQLAAAVARSGSDAKAPIRHYFVCPGISGRGLPRYEWTLLVEQPSTIDRDMLRAALDRALSVESPDYKEAAEEGYLDPCHVRILDAEVARRYFARDSHRGQLKMKTAFDTKEKLAEFLRGLDVGPEGPDASGDA